MKERKKGLDGIKEGRIGRKGEWIEIQRERERKRKRRTPLNTSGN